MNETKKVTNDVINNKEPMCNVNMTFNLIVGVLAIAAALLIGYVVYVYWWM